MSYGERKKFYKSKLWEKVKTQVWLKQYCVCAICGTPVYVAGINDYIPKSKRITGIVHHKEHLNDINVNDYNITCNEDNLIGVCKYCHEHICHNDGTTRDEYTFDENGNLIERKMNEYLL